MAVGFLAVLLASCGPRLMYTNLDWLVPWYVDDYITLDAQQRDQLTLRLARQLDWHCRTQMPRYAEFLNQLRAEIRIPGQPVTAERWSEHLEQVRQYWIDLVRRLAPDALAILATASDAQIDALFFNLEKTNRELAREYVAPPVAERQRNRRRRIQKRLTYWTGRLEADQKKLLADWSRDVEESAEDWLSHRRQVQQALHRMLGERRRETDFERRFVALLTQPGRLRTPAYEARIQANKRLAFAMLEKISGSLTLAQRRHIVDRLAKLAEELNQLACEVPRNETSGRP
jgi:hypothetical protein